MANNAQSEWVGAVVTNIWRINPNNFESFSISGGWNNTVASAVAKNRVYCVQNDGNIWKVNPNNGEYRQIQNLTGWQTCVALVGLDNKLYAFCKALYRITASKGTGSYEQISDGWGNTIAATGFGGKLYAVTKNGKLWEIEASSGAYKELASGGFEDTHAITHHDGKLYIFGNDLKRVVPANAGAPETVSKGWQNTIPHCATTCAGNLFAVTQNGKVWKINPQDGTYTQALTGWENTKFLFSVLREDSMNIENNKNEESDSYDVFISHRQVTGGDLAMTLKLLLLQENPKLKIFLDVDDLHNVHNLEKNIENTKNIILLVTEGALERPFVQLEIRAGLKYKKNFVLVHDSRSCNFPSPDSLPEDIRPVTHILAVPWMREKVFRDVSLKEIIKKLI